MRKFQYRYGLLMVLFVCALSICPAAAAEAPRQAPEVIARVDVKSPALLLSRLDNFVAAVTAGRKNELPAGTVTMMAAFSLPVPLDSFDAEAPAQIVFLAGKGGRTDMAIVLSAPDFAAFLDTLGGVVPLTRSDDALAPASSLSLHTGRGIAVAELPDGKVALYANPDLTERLPDLSWLPDYDGASLVFAEIPLREDTIAGAADILRERLELDRDDILEGMSEFKINETAAAGIFSLLQEYVPELVAEAAVLGSVRIAVDFNTEALTLRVSARPEAESAIERIAAGLEAAGSLDVTEMERLPATAASVAVMRSVNDLFAAEDMERVVDTVFSRVLPALRDDALALLARSRAAFTGKSTAAVFPLDYGRQLDIELFHAPDPAAALAVFADAMDFTNRIIEALIDEPKHRFRLVSAPAGGADGFTEYKLEFPDPDMSRALEEIAGEGVLDVSGFTELRIYAGIRDGVLHTLSGEAEEGELARVLSLLDEKGPAFTSDPSARAAMEWLKGGKAVLALVKAKHLLPMILYNILAEKAGANRELFDTVMEKMPSFPSDGGDAIGFSFATGVAEGEIELLGYVPAEGASAVLGDWEAFDAAAKQMRREAAAGGDDADESEPDEDEDLQEEDEEEDAWQDEDGDAIILDAPADAS